MTLGTVVAGKTITIGRRKAAIILQSVAFIGGLITLILTVPTICLGRFLYGFTAGHANIIMGKSLDETVPREIFGLFGWLTNTLINVGIMLIWFMGSILPTNEADYADDEMWRVLFSVPCWLALV